jgi:diguanylate cyclase (GGDEF)-like protein
MPSLPKYLLKPLLAPGLCLLAVAALLHSGLLAPAPALLAYAFYGVVAAGLLIAWRFHSSRIFFALLVVLLSQQAIAFFSAGRIYPHTPGATALACAGVLLPLNFILISLQQEKGFIVPTLAPAAMLLFLESVLVAVLCRPDPVAAASRMHRALAPSPLPWATVLAGATAACLLLLRYWLFRKPAESGLLWALVASLLALRFGGIGRIPPVYFLCAAALLASALVENSYLLAYQDELTALPSRRAFQESLLRLQAPYSIAMLDIDHFKRCNDTYGHDTGDEVLRLVAGRLARVTGGGRAYRCGGEEFAIVFAGKTTSEILADLEALRASIEHSSFRLRGEDRRRLERGADRRSSASRAAKPGKAMRAVSAWRAEISVTASIGVAASGKTNASPEEVIRAADQALYRAKNAGRNRIEVEGAKPRQARRKTAGIA